MDSASLTTTPIKLNLFQILEKLSNAYIAVGKFLDSILDPGTL